MVLSGSPEKIQERYQLYYAFDDATIPPVLMVGGLYWDGANWVKKMDGLVAGVTTFTWNGDGTVNTIAEVRGGRTCTSTFAYAGGEIDTITDVIT